MTMDRAGRPVVGLVAMAAAWIAIRVVTVAPVPPEEAAARVAFVSKNSATRSADVAERERAARSGTPVAYPQRVDLRAATVGDVVERPYPERVALAAPTAVEPTVVPAPAPATTAAAHGAIFLSLFSSVPVAVLSNMAATSTARTGEVAVPRERSRRWSLDAWAFVREGSSRAGFGPRPGTLGASQTGYVARYSPAPDSRFRPAVYTRLAKALIEGGETDTALGVQIRPIPGLPINLHGEVRATDVQSRSFIRPAVFATSGFYDVPLGLGFTGRGYAQGGYVGGDFATGFVDGHALAERSILRESGIDMRIGGGVWGGAQQGVSRVDVGPMASYTFRVANKAVRFQADYRFRVAGDAEPADGASLTLSTSF